MDIFGEHYSSYCSLAIDFMFQVIHLLTRVTEDIF